MLQTNYKSFFEGDTQFADLREKKKKILSLLWNFINNRLFDYII